MKELKVKPRPTSREAPPSVLTQLSPPATHQETPQTPPINSPIQEWFTRFLTALDALLTPSACLGPPPEKGDPGTRLKLLSEIRHRLRVRDDSRSPIREAANSIANQATGPNQRDSLCDLIGLSLEAIDRSIVGCLDSLPPDQREGYIFTADFQQTRMLSFPHVTEQTPMTGHPESILWVVGIVTSLPLEHPLRTILPADDYYQLDRMPDLPPTTVLILGRSEPYVTGGGRPKPFYLLSDCLRWTAYFRNGQRREDEERAEQERLEEKRVRERFWHSDLGRLEEQRRYLDELRAKGKIPPYTSPDPVIR